MNLLSAVSSTVQPSEIHACLIPAQRQNKSVRPGKLEKYINWNIVTGVRCLLGTLAPSLHMFSSNLEFAVVPEVEATHMTT